MKSAMGFARGVGLTLMASAFVATVDASHQGAWFAFVLGLGAIVTAEWFERWE